MLVPAVTSLSYSEDTNIATTTVANTSGEAAIAFASLLYKENTAAQNDESSGPRIILNDVDLEQSFNPTSNHSELIGSTTTTTNYLQMRTEGGGDGAKFLVKSTANTTVTCEKITFRIRSQEEDVVAFDVTIAGETQSFDYTSSSTTDDIYIDFDTPITFTNTSQELEVLTTALTNAGGLTPRFRIYNLTFHLGTVGLDDVEDNGQNLNLYPNPVKDIFSLTKEVESGILYDLRGVKVYEFKNQ